MDARTEGLEQPEDVRTVVLFICTDKGYKCFKALFHHITVFSCSRSYLYLPGMIILNYLKKV